MIKFLKRIWKSIAGGGFKPPKEKAIDATEKSIAGGGFKPTEKSIAGGGFKPPKK